MTIERITSPAITEPAPGLWSNALRVGDALYLSGLTARNRAGQVVGDNEYEQAQRIFERIGQLLEAAGAHPNDVVRLNLFLTRIDHREQVWKARREFFDAADATRCFPAATLVEVSSLQPGVLVEIEATAHLGHGGRPLEVRGG